MISQQIHYFSIHFINIIRLVATIMTLLTSTLELFTATACKVIPFEVVVVVLDGTVETCGTCIDFRGFDPLPFSWVDGTIIGSVFINIGETVDVSVEFAIFVGLISKSEAKLFWDKETLFEL